MSKLESDDLRWALQRRIESVFAKLGEKFGDLTGRVETYIRPSVSLDHLRPQPQAREASARLVATLCDRLDGVPESARILVIASTSRTDAVDAALVTPGRLDHLVEVALPYADEQREILELLKARMER